eukprot:scaffold4526_cov89-Isochrysis_galbana.AAC.1
MLGLGYMARKHLWAAAWLGRERMHEPHHHRPVLQHRHHVVVPLPQRRPKGWYARVKPEQGGRRRHKGAVVAGRGRGGGGVGGGGEEARGRREQPQHQPALAAFGPPAGIFGQKRGEPRRRIVSEAGA